MTITSGSKTAAQIATALSTAAFPTTQPANCYYEMVAPNDVYHDNVLTIQNLSLVGGTGAPGNAAIRFRDNIINYERGALGYSAVATGNSGGFFPNTLYGEIGNIGPAADPDDTSFAIISTHAASATHFPGTSYKAFEVRGDTGDINVRTHANTLWFKLVDAIPGVVIGTDAGVNNPPVNGLLISGHVGIGTGANTPIAKNIGNTQVEIDGGVNIDPSHLGNASNVLSVITGTSTDGIRYTQNNVGAIFMGHSTIGVLGTDGLDLAFKTGISGGNTSTGTERLRILAAGGIKFSDAASWSANGSVATVLGSLGPAGSHTSVQTWFTAVDSGGTTRYVPGF